MFIYGDHIRQLPRGGPSTGGRPFCGAREKMLHTKMLQRNSWQVRARRREKKTPIPAPRARLGVDVAEVRCRILPPGPARRVGRSLNAQGRGMPEKRLSYPDFSKAEARPRAGAIRGAANSALESPQIRAKMTPELTGPPL